MRSPWPPYIDTRVATIIIAPFALKGLWQAIRDKDQRLMQIEVDRLDETGESFAHTYAPDEILLEDERAELRRGPEISGNASRQGEQVRLRGRISAEVEARCDRCLSPVSVPIAAEFDETFIPVVLDAETDEAKELQAEDMNFSVYEGEAIDINELVREQVLLALPTRLLCQEECQGLCPVCGADKNTQACTCEQTEIDPRWAALAALKQDRQS